MDSQTGRKHGDGMSNRSSSQVKAPPPHFFQIIHASLVPTPLQKLKIPMKFLSRYGKNLGNHLILKVPSGALWEVGLEKSNGGVWMCNGWEEFVKYYSIGIGHLLVFRYDGNCNFNVLIFDRSTSEIEYPVGAIHGKQANGERTRNSKIPVKEEVIEIDDSVETLGDMACARYTTKRKKIYGSREIGKLGIRSCHKASQALYDRENMPKDVPVGILDDSLVRDFPVSERERANSRRRMENNADNDKHEFPLDIQSKKQKLPNQTKDAKTKTENEYIGGMCIGGRWNQSQVHVEMLSARTNINSTALERAQHFESKKPFFTIHLPPTYVSGHCYMNVPMPFVKKYLRHDQKNVTLRISNGKTWLVRFCWHGRNGPNGKRNFAWAQFVQDNNLHVGDICVFELSSSGIEPQLDVTIFRK